MKDKILETEIRQHAEALANALRKYSGEPLHFRLTVFTRDNTVGDEGDTPDYFDVVCSAYDETENFDPIISQAFLIHYGDEGIRMVEPFWKYGDNDNDLPN